MGRSDCRKDQFLMKWESPDKTVLSLEDFNGQAMEGVNLAKKCGGKTAT